MEPVAVANILAAGAILLGLALVLIRIFRGPDAPDRVLGVNAFGVLVVLLICVCQFIAGRPDFLDLALLYVLLNFIVSVALLWFFHAADQKGGGEGQRDARSALHDEDSAGSASEPSPRLRSGPTEE